MVPAKFDTPAEALRGSFESNFRMPFDDDTKYARLFESLKARELSSNGGFPLTSSSIWEPLPRPVVGQIPWLDGVNLHSSSPARSTAMRPSAPPGFEDRGLRPLSDTQEVPDVVQAPIRTWYTSPFQMLPATPPRLPFVLKMTNISWEISQQDVRDFLKGYPLSNIFIPIDRTTGKTLNQVFVEFGQSFHPGERKLPSSLELRQGEKIKGRPVTLSASSMNEVFETHFPEAAPEDGVYLNREEINSILAICRNYKIHFSRKCAERPFEHVISIMKLIPPQRLGTMARDHVFELVKLTMEALKGHMRKANCQIDPKVLDSLCETCIEFTAFTEKQKQVIQNVASSTPEPARQDLETNYVPQYHTFSAAPGPANGSVHKAQEGHRSMDSHDYIMDLILKYSR